MFDRKLLRNVDWLLPLTALLLMGFGLVIVYSATRKTLGLTLGEPLYFVIRQLMYALVGTVAALALISTDYRVFGQYYKPIYLGTLGILGLVLVYGQTINGTTGWFRVGPVGMQPAEFAKLSVIVTLARHLEKKESLDNPLDLVSPFIHVGIPMGLILLQPDFGTAMVFGGILFGMLYVAGARPLHLLAAMGAGVGSLVLAVVGTKLGFLHILKPHQIDRILVFLDPYAYRTGAGWNVIQSMIAIGSGGFFGKGLFGGTQTQLNFLPAHHTDFIFSVVGEELGFMGAFLLLVLYAVLLHRGLRVVVMAKDRFGALVAAGVISMFLFHLMINIGMTLGIMPVTGIPLPFISFGGSSLLTNVLAVGLLIGIQMRKQKIRF